MSTPNFAAFPLCFGRKYASKTLAALHSTANLPREGRELLLCFPGEKRCIKVSCVGEFFEFSVFVA